MSLFAAVDVQGNTRYIGDVPRGAACNCFCAECNSPLVAKQGEEHAWHFAHEASQERPQCLPGSLNLLRRLAMQTLVETSTLTPPACRVFVEAGSRFDAVRDVVSWQLPSGTLLTIDLAAAVGRRVGQFHAIGLEALKIGIWVQIGDQPVEQDDGCDGVLVYQCRAPFKGEVTTKDSAQAFLEAQGGWIWQMHPDAFGERSAAQSRVDARFAEQQDRQAKKLEQLKALMGRREAQWPRDHPSGHQQIGIFGRAGAAVPPEQPVPPGWTTLKKTHGSYFAFQMRSGEFWIVVEAADQLGYYIVPGSGQWEGWDEALPTTLGVADVSLGVYRGAGSIDQAIGAMRRLGVAASRTDSNYAQICKFTGWQPSLV